MTKGVVVICALLFGLCTGTTTAQVDNFNQTGRVVAIVSEAETSTSTDTVQFGDIRFPIRKKTKTDFYFVYPAFQNGVPSEKWIALADDPAWSKLSNQTVRLTASLKNNLLSNVSVTALTTLSREQLLFPPPTTGIYKIVAVPLTIQPTAAQRNSDPDLLGVTPEAIRDVLFDRPNSVNKFYHEASYGKLQFAGVHHPQVDVVPATIQATISSNCQDQIVTEFTPIVRQRLMEQNIDTTNGSVDIGIIIFNDLPTCPPYPFTTRGPLGGRGTTWWLWMPESWFVTGPAIMAHEIGHVLGGNHPAALRCTDFDDTPTCTIIANASDRDMMTYAAAYYLLPNNYERLRWGWHPPGVFDNPTTKLDHIFDLHSPALPFFKDGIKDRRYYLRFLSGAYAGGWAIFPEARRTWGMFERYQPIDDAFRLGVAVRMGHANFGDPDAISILLDPNTTVGLDDAPLREGQQVSIGGVNVQTVKDHNPQRGTRVRVRQVSP